MNDMNEETIEKMRREYHDPPAVPRDEMWAAIEPRLGETPDVIPISAGATSRRPLRVAGWAGGIVAAAAVLVVGIGLGRMSVQVDESVRPALVPTVETSPTSYRAAALQHLSRSESLLALVKSDVRAGRYDAEVAGWGRALLLETRLLMDSPAGEDVRLHRLLEDLELILIQVAQLSPDAGAAGPDGEMGLIAEAMENRDMMMRIRSVLPQSGPQAGI